MNISRFALLFSLVALAACSAEPKEPEQTNVTEHSLAEVFCIDDSCTDRDGNDVDRNTIEVGTVVDWCNAEFTSCRIGPEGPRVKID